MVIRVPWLVCWVLAASACKDRPPRDIAPTPVEVKLDLDNNGTVEDRERVEARKQRLATILLRLDHDHDGKVSVAELAGTDNPFLQFHDPAGVDRDRDGFISASEVDTAIEARQQAMRASWENPGSAQR
jgi:hypothetical protein